MKNPPMEAQALAKWLNDEGACRASLKWQHGKNLRETWDTCQRDDWLEWLLNACGYQWKAPAWAEYQRVNAPAWAEYQRVNAPALAEYQRVTADTIRTILPYPFK